MDDLERQRRTRKLLLGGCLVGGLVAVPVTLMILPILAVVLGFAASKQHHDANKQHMQTPQVAQAVARELALYCQSVTAPISDHSTGDAWLPQVLRDCHPAYGEVGPDGARFEMHGGFDHYGYDLSRDAARTTATHTTWTLRFYTEKGGATLCSVVLGRDEKLSTDELVARAVSEYDRRLAESQHDVGVWRQKLMFLLRFERLDAARQACVDLARALPEHWQPRYAAAHLGARVGQAGASAREYGEWTRAHPRFDHFVYLFLFHMREGSRAEALAAIRAALEHPVVEEDTTVKSAGYLGVTCAVYAIEQGDFDLAAQVCDHLDSAGLEPHWAGQAARARAAVAARDRSFAAAWVKDRGWPNLFNSNSTQPDHAGVMFPSTWKEPGSR